MTSNLLWLAPVLSLLFGTAMQLARDRRVLTALDIAGSFCVLGLAL